jgi:hypothetical protein
MPGVIKIDVAKLSLIRLRIAPAGDHANIQDVPYDTPETRSEAIRYTDAIINCCEVVAGP